MLLLPVAFKLTVSFNLSERTLSGEASHATFLQLYSFDRPTGIDENSRTTEATPRHLPAREPFEWSTEEAACCVFLLKYGNFFVIPPALLPGETTNADPLHSYCRSDGVALNEVWRTCTSRISFPARFISTGAVQLLVRNGLWTS